MVGPGPNAYVKYTNALVLAAVEWVRSRTALRSNVRRAAVRPAGKGKGVFGSAPCFSIFGLCLASLAVARAQRQAALLRAIAFRHTQLLALAVVAAPVAVTTSTTAARRDVGPSTPGWTNLAATVADGLITNAPSSCLALDGANIRNGFYVEIGGGSNYCCVERGNYDGTSVCMVGCHSSIRTAGEFAKLGDSAGDVCSSRCYDTLGDLPLDTSIVAPNGVIDGPAVTFDLSVFTGVGITVSIGAIVIDYVTGPDLSSSQTTAPVSTFLVTKTTTNSPASTGKFAAYGLDSGYSAAGSYGKDVFCTSKGPYDAVNGCADSCGNRILHGRFAIVGDFCYFDCYLPRAGTCTYFNPPYTFTPPLDLASCWQIFKANSVFHAFQYNSPTFSLALLPLQYATVSSQQNCVLTLGSGLASLATKTCGDCASLCNNMTTWESSIFAASQQCSQYTCDGVAVAVPAPAPTCTCYNSQNVALSSPAATDSLNCCNLCCDLPGVSCAVGSLDTYWYGVGNLPVSVGTCA